MQDSKKSDYWAAAPIEEIAAAIEEKFEDYKEWGRSTGYFNRIESAYNAFYGLDSDGTLRITRNGDDVAEIKVNHYKSLVRRLHILVTENKLAFQPRARNSDSKSQIESDLAKGIAEYYADEKGMHGTLSDAVLGALIMLEQHVHCSWDIAEGYELTADGQRVIKSGDQMFEIFNPFNVAKATATEKSSWHIIRKKVNKHDEAALWPEFADEILGADADPAELDGGAFQSMSAEGQDDDVCYKFIMYHARTPAMPEGRHVEVIGGQVLFSRKLKYDKVPLFRITAGDVLGTCFGDSPAIDLLPLQQGLDALFSGTLTNNLNNAKQLIYSADPNLTTRKLGDGQTLVTASSPPSGLNLTGSSAENFRMIDLLVNHQQLLSGVNDVARGNPSASLKSGTSLAVILAQAIQYVSNLQKNYAYLAGEVGSCLISNIQKFASEEMTAYITGASRRGQIKKFKASDLMNVERITVDLGNPLTQSFAGRNEMVTAWQQYGILKDPKQIVSFLRTGELDQTTENQFSDAILIREENERLRKGEVPAVLLTDNHSEHIVDHKGIMSSQEARDNPQVLAAWRVHVQAHIDIMRDMPPDLAAVLTGQPLPPPVDPSQMPVPGQPEINGAAMPNVPEGTPPQVAANYQQALDAVPEEQTAEGF